MSKSRSPTQYKGVRAILPPDLQMALRPPTSADKAYIKGTLWLDTAASTAWMWPGSGDWIALGSGTTGAIVTLTGDSGGAISPVAGNIDILGTANEIAVIGTAGTLTLSLPSALIAPGSIATTTTLTATLGNITATNGNIVRGTAGNKDVYTSVASTTTAGDNSAGTVTLVAGEAIIATTAITASSQIRLYRQDVGATGAAAMGILSILTRTAGVSFTIRSCDPADATAAQAADVSVIGWEIVN